MPHKANILLVDDRDENLMALEAVLTSLDQNMVRASSGEAALKALLEEDFAVILLDVVMPGMDGFETAAHIKQREKTKDIPIIFLTAEGIDRHQVFRGYASRFVDYMTKPLDPWLLRAKVEVFLELDRLRRQLLDQSARLRRGLAEETSGAGGSVVAEMSALVGEVNQKLELLRERAVGDENATVEAARELDAPVGRLTRLVEALHGPE
ncbi:response regulator [Actinorugispora endophytica]|uniref:response regulator n=1 Tax=Actinorugispora endophytica TaxID=1605990 RepID=UPI001061C4EE|nr:response regulator [Actinorugispora endophytica]